MKDKSKTHPTELNYSLLLEKFTVDLFFIQTIIHLYESNVIEFKFEEFKTGLFIEKKYYLDIGANFFSYTSKNFEYEFLKVFYQNTGKIEIGKYISLVINELLKSSNWKKKLEEKFSEKEKLKNETKQEVSSIIKTTKYFNYSNYSKPVLKPENNHKKELYILETNLNFNLIDLVYEKAKLFILKKESKPNNSHWGNINATAGI
ncbi:hypothetical protein [Wenyingzhuangia sp. IMCC45574]